MRAERIETDLLIVGSGFAGLWAAIAVREAGVARVTVVDKAAIAMSSQSRLCAGATIYCLPEDDAEVWLRDIVEANGFLSRQPLVAEILETSYQRLCKLEDWGVSYPAPDHAYVRIPSRGLEHVKMMVMPRFRDRTGGSAVVDALRRRAIGARIAQHPRVLVTDLLQREGRIAGAVGLDRTTAEPIAFVARAVLLATADCSFRGNYVCTDGTTGDGFRPAYDQGVRLSNMEFLCTNTGSPKFGFEGTGVALKWGGRLLNAKGESFMESYHRDANAAEIHELTRAMVCEAEKGHGPPFYVEMGDAWKARIGPALAGIGGFMPLNLAKLEAGGVDLAQPQEWVPAVQTLRGGVRVEPDGQSDLSGLFAAGMTEALDPGLFNGWSTMRAMGSGERSGRGAAVYLRDAAEVSPDSDEIAALSEFAASDPHELAKLHETRNMVRVAEMFLRASLARTESRGSHFRADHPEPDNERWLSWINLRKEGEGGMRVETEPVPLGRYPIQPRADRVST